MALRIKAEITGAPGRGGLKKRVKSRFLGSFGLGYHNHPFAFVVEGGCGVVAVEVREAEAGLGEEEVHFGREAVAQGEGHEGAGEGAVGGEGVVVVEDAGDLIETVE